MADDPNVALQALLDAATPGEWQTIAGTPDGSGWSTGVSVMILGVLVRLTIDDTRLIAAAPRELRRLLAAVHERDAEIERLRSDHRHQWMHILPGQMTDVWCPDCGALAAWNLPEGVRPNV